MNKLILGLGLAGFLLAGCMHSGEDGSQDGEENILGSDGEDNGAPDEGSNGSEPNNGSGGSPATESTILGKWFFKTFDVDGELQMTIPGYIDTTLPIDTSGTFPPDNYLRFNADGTQMSVTDNSIFENLIPFPEMDPNSDPYAYPGSPKTGAVMEMDTITGTWYIQGGKLYLVDEYFDEDFGYEEIDTTEVSATINGDNAIFVMESQESESDQGGSFSMDMVMTINAQK